MKRDFELKYINLEENFYSSYKNRQNNKRFWGISLLGTTLLFPLLIYILLNQRPGEIKAISSANTSIFDTTNTHPSPTEVKILKNDSYWKISKRYCGDPKFFLAIRDLNERRPLFEGDFAKVTCVK